MNYVSLPLAFMFFYEINSIEMFNKATIGEKRLIMAFIFDILWNKLWHEVNSLNNIIYHKK